MSHSSPVAYLFDVDNTLLDSDRVVDDLRRHLSREFSADDQQHYWKIFEQQQDEHGYADYLGALQRFRCEKPAEQEFLKLSMYLLNYPFADRLFPRALDVIAYLKQRGVVTIVSDGDVVFQPRKIETSGLFEAVEGRILVYIHKEKDLRHVEHHFPAHHYVVVEDKPRVLTAAKNVWKDRATTIFVRQGRRAHDPKHVDPYPRADITVERIGDLLKSDFRHQLERF